MTHYSRYCLHLGCGEPLDNASASLLRVKKQAKEKAKSVKAKQKQGKKEIKKDE